jgi:SAM-dependent methyltransferase
VTERSRLCAAIFVVSAAVLCLEVVYTRLFSFSIWYHFAYATISIALLGFGASGSLLAAFPRLRGGDPLRRMALLAALAAPATIASLAITSVTPFDPFRLTTEPVQLLWLAVYDLAVLLPFLLAGFCIALGLAARPRDVGIVYFADLLGAGCGAFAAMPLLASVGAPRAIVLAAVALAIAAVVLRPRAPVPLAMLAVGALLLPAADALGPRPCPCKTLGHIVQDTGAEVLYSRWNAIARIDVAGWRDEEASRSRGLWSIWGRGARNQLASPPQYTIAQDADAFTLMYRFRGDFAELDFLNDHILHTPYVIAEAPRVLVIGAGGGTDVLAGLKFGARHVTAVDINPVTASLLTDVFADWLGGVFRDRPEVSVQVAEGRNFARRADAPYDVVQVNGVDTLAAMASGSYVLAESYLYTVEAVRDLRGRLSDDGLLSVVIMDPLGADTPPRHMLRLLGVFLETLEREGVAAPADHVAVIGAPEPENVTRLVQKYDPRHRPIMAMQLLLKRSPLTAADTSRLAAFTRDAGFTLWHIPGVATDPALRQLLAGRDARRAFQAAFPLAIDATTDDRPFFFSFYRWADVWRAARLDPNRSTAMGQLMLMVMLVQGIVLGGVFILAPMATRQRAALRVPGRSAYLLYFAALGLGFICLEIPLIQRFVLFLGYPTRSLTVTLAAMLVATGLGSLMSQRFTAPPERLLPRLLGLLAAIVIGYLVVLPAVFDALLTAPAGIRAAVTVGLILPLGLVLGCFFPLGVRALPDERLLPWGWAMNGLATVVGTIVAIMAAMTWGFTVVMLGALATYAVGVLVLATFLSRRRAA